MIVTIEMIAMKLMMLMINHWLFCYKNRKINMNHAGVVLEERLESHRGFSFSSRDSEAIDVDRVQAMSVTSQMTRYA